MRGRSDFPLAHAQTPTLNPPVLAFLKRRWILLSCVVVLVCCGFFDLYHVRNYGADGRVDPVAGQRIFGLWKGAFYYIFTGWMDVETTAAVHELDLGGQPVFMTEGNVIISLPLWLPLSA